MNNVPFEVQGVLRRSYSTVECGDTFVFNDLVGSHLEQQKGTSERYIKHCEPDQAERLITVHSVSTSGDVSYRIDMVNLEDGSGPYEPTLASVPYDRALLLIEHQIWQAVRLERDADA